MSANLQQTLQLAFAHHQAGRLEQARALYQQVLSQQPNNPDALNLLGMVAYATGDLKTALELIQRAVAVQPAVPDYHNNLGLVFSGLGQHDRAEAEYRTALKLKPDSFDANYGLGIALYHQNKLDQAIESYRHAIALNPASADAHNNLANALRDKGLITEAILHYERAGILNSNDVEIASNLALARKDEILRKYISSFGGSKGLLYVGANDGSEIPLCKRLAEKVYAFEPIAADSVWGKLIQYQDERTFCFNVALSDREGEQNIYPASNNYQSSALLMPKKHVDEFRDVQFASPITIKTKRLDSYDFFKTCDILIMDAQGYEMKVLNGISDFGNLKLIITEFTNIVELYEGGCSFDDLYQKLKDEGFYFAETTTVHFNPATKLIHGNAIFIKP